MPLVLRLVKGRELTHAELDQNQAYLEDLANSKVAQEAGKVLIAQTVLNTLTGQTHTRNADVMLAEGTSQQVSATELRSHLDNHGIDSVTGLPAVLNTLTGQTHTRNTDTLLASGTTQQVSASELRNHLDNHGINSVSGLTSALSTLSGQTQSKVNKTDIVDNLDQATAGKVLDALQGKVLKDMIQALPTGNTSSEAQLPVYSTFETISLTGAQSAITENFTLVDGVVNPDHSITFTNFNWTGFKLVYVFGFGASQTDFTITVDGSPYYYFGQAIFAYPETVVTIACTRTDDSQPFELRLLDGNLAIATGTLWNFSATLYVVQNPRVSKHAVMSISAENGIVASRYFGTNYSSLIARDDFAILSYQANAKGIASVLAGEGGAILEYINTANGKSSFLNVTDANINLTARNITVYGDQQDPNVGGIRYSQDFSANYTERSLIDKAYVDGRIAAAGGAGGSALKAAKYITVKELENYDYNGTTLSKPKIVRQYSFNSDFYAPIDTIYEIGTAYEYPIIIFQTDFNGYYIHPVTGAMEFFYSAATNNGNNPLNTQQWVIYTGSNDAQTITFYLATGVPYCTLTSDVSNLQYGYGWVEFDYVLDANGQWPVYYSNDTIFVDDIDWNDSGTQTLGIGDRIVVSNQSNLIQNGIYTLTAQDTLTTTEEVLEGGSHLFILDGQYKNHGFIVDGLGVRVIGSEPISFTMFTTDLQYYVSKKPISLIGKDSAHLGISNYDPDLYNDPHYNMGFRLFPGSSEMYTSNHLGDAVYDYGFIENHIQGITLNHQRYDAKLPTADEQVLYRSAISLREGKIFVHSKAGIQYEFKNYQGQNMPLELQPNSLVPKSYVDEAILSVSGGSINLSNYNTSSGITLNATQNIELDAFKTTISSEKKVGDKNVYDYSFAEVLAEGITLESQRYDADLIPTASGDSYINRSRLALNNGIINVHAPHGIQYVYQDYQGQQMPLILQPNSLVHREWVENALGSRKFTTYLASIQPGDVITHNLGTQDIIVQFRDENGVQVSIPNTAGVNILTLNPAQALTNIKIIAMI